METMRGRGDTMTWTHDTPTVEGFYWLVGRYEGVGGKPIVVELQDVCGDLEMLWPGSDWDTPVRKLPKSAWWMGPIEEPDPPQEVTT